jgi:hypothetical protein
MPTPSEIIAAHIRAKTLNALQDADEIGGPDHADYVSLMVSLAAECQRRAQTAREQDPQVQVLRWARKNIGVNAEITNTGGGCTALEIPAAREGYYWWVTDELSAPGSMTPETDTHFSVGLYAPDGDRWVCFNVSSMAAVALLIESATAMEFGS